MKIAWAARASREISALDREVARRIVTGVERFAETEHGDTKRLQGAGGIARLRVGDWRILFENSPGGIRILRVLHRSEAYR